VPAIIRKYFSGISPDQKSKNMNFLKIFFSFFRLLFLKVRARVRVRVRV